MTPFMERVADALDLADADLPVELTAPQVRDSRPKPAPVGADEQVALRALAEQLVSEANAVLHGRRPLLTLDDQLVDGQLSFRLRYGDRAAIVRTRFDGELARAELIGVGAHPDQHLELAGPQQLQPLILLLLSQPVTEQVTAFR